MTVGVAGGSPAEPVGVFVAELVGVPALGATTPAWAGLLSVSSSSDGGGGGDGGDDAIDPYSMINPWSYTFIFEPKVELLRAP